MGAGNSRAVIGANDGLTCPRLSLRSLQANTDQWNLYLMATDNMKNMDQQSPGSFYDVASVHGVPAQPWDGVQGTWNGNTAPGYCTHSSPVFPPWHRVYMALYEQSMLSSAQAVVNQFTGNDKTRYQNALRCLRIPYWDWAQGPGKANTVVPDIMTTKYVNVPNPSGGTRQIINPIFRYDFHPLDKAAMAQDPWDFWPTTLRYPTRSDTVNTYSQNNLFTQAVQNQAQSLHDQVYNFFTQCGDYMMIANDAAPLSGQCAQSLESVHNTIHNLIGGFNDGHMTYLWWSAFDPAFYIHHANVDRLFAMWQVLYPNSYITGGQSSTGTYSQPVGTYYDGNTALDPFHNTNGQSWNANAARYVSTFKYTYPELQQANGNAATMRNIVNQLYGTSSAANAVSKRDSTTNASSLLVPTGRKTDYVANLAASRFGLDGSFNIYLFLGQPQGDAQYYFLAPNLIGSQGIFANPGMQMDETVLVTGSIPLTTTLAGALQRGELASLDEADVGPYLRKNLFWRDVTAKGELIDTKSVPGFKIGIVRSDVTPAATDKQFPTWHGFDTLSNITAGLPGGVKLSETWETLDLTI